TFVVTDAKIVCRRSQIDLTSQDRPWQIQCVEKPEHAPLPRSVEHRLIRLAMNWPHILHPDHVVYAVHECATSAGDFTIAIPTMASRVTRDARSVSLIPSVLDGRSGRTR